MSILIAASGCAARRPTSSFSDLQRRLKPGNTVYVIDDTGTEIKGKIVTLSAAALTLDVNGIHRPMDQASIRQVQRYGDSLWNGFFIGVGVSTPGVLIADPKKGPPGVVAASDRPARPGPWNDGHYRRRY